MTKQKENLAKMNGFCRRANQNRLAPCPICAKANLDRPMKALPTLTVDPSKIREIDPERMAVTGQCSLMGHWAEIQVYVGIR